MRGSLYQHHVCDQGHPGFHGGTSSSHGHHPSLPFWTGLSPEILLILKLKPFWMGIRMVLCLRCKENAGRFSVKFSFGLKIWNSFAPLTHSQMPREASTWIHNARMPLSSVLLFLIVQKASYSFSLRGYTIAVLGKSFSELWFPHL